MLIMVDLSILILLFFKFHFLILNYFKIQIFFYLLNKPYFLLVIVIIYFKKKFLLIYCFFLNYFTIPSSSYNLYHNFFLFKKH